MTEGVDQMLDIIEALVWENARLSGLAPEYLRATGWYRLDGTPTANARACLLLVAEGRAEVFLHDPIAIIIKPKGRSE